MKLSPKKMRLFIGVTAFAGFSFLLFETPSIDTSPDSQIDISVIEKPDDTSEQKSLFQASSINRNEEHTETINPTAKPLSTIVEATHQDLLKELVENTLEELHLEQGYSSYNLMLLKDLAAKTQDLTPDQLKDLISNQVMQDWPDEMLEAFHKITIALYAENDLIKEWGEKRIKEPESYRSMFLENQKNVLGLELFERLYHTDQIVVDESGLHANLNDLQTKDIYSNPEHQKKLALFKQWQLDALSETELKESLLNDLSNAEIDQVIETVKHESEWLNQISVFLTAYQYIEKAGLSGEDELIQRQELLEKYFSSENRQIANQFLFGQR